MGRLATPRAVDSIYKSEGGSGESDKYAGRVAKYIPGETLSAYVALQAILTEPSNLWYGLFAILLIGTPIYMYKSRDKGKPWVLNAFICTLAFLVWSYALHDPDKFTPWMFINDSYQGPIAAAFLIMFTFIAGIFPPKSN